MEAVFETRFGIDIDIALKVALPCGIDIALQVALAMPRQECNPMRTIKIAFFS